jgi:hypothetical protein
MITHSQLGTAFLTRHQSCSTGRVTYSEETAAAIRGLRPWVTNEYEHDGLRADGAIVLDRLIDLARGRS